MFVYRGDKITRQNYVFRHSFSILTNTATARTIPRSFQLCLSRHSTTLFLTFAATSPRLALTPPLRAPPLSPPQQDPSNSLTLLAFTENYCSASEFRTIFVSFNSSETLF